MWLEFFLPSLRDTNSKNNTFLFEIYRSLNTLKGTAKVPAVAFLGPNTPRGRKTAFLTPKRYDDPPPPRHSGNRVLKAHFSFVHHCEFGLLPVLSFEQTFTLD